MDPAGLASEPWWPYDAVRLLERLIEPSWRGFEWGSGGSTPWLSGRTSGLISVEHDPSWYAIVALGLTTAGARNVDHRLVLPDGAATVGDDYEQIGLRFESYCKVIDEVEAESLDYVMVDGRARLACLRHAVPKVAPGGYLFLDNSDDDQYQFELPFDGWSRIDVTGRGDAIQGVWMFTAWRRTEI